MDGLKSKAAFFIDMGLLYLVIICIVAIGLIVILYFFMEEAIETRAWRIGISIAMVVGMLNLVNSILYTNNKEEELIVTIFQEEFMTKDVQIVSTDEEGRKVKVGDDLYQVKIVGDGVEYEKLDRVYLDNKEKQDK